MAAVIAVDDEQLVAVAQSRQGRVLRLGCGGVLGQDRLLGRHDPAPARARQHAQAPASRRLRGRSRSCAPHARPDPAGQASTQPAWVLRPPPSEDASPNAVRSQSAMSPWPSTKPGGVQPGDHLGAKCLADEVCRPGLRRVREHRKCELERAFRRAAPVERRVAAVGKMRQRLQLRPLHDVHLGLRWTPPHVVAHGRLQAAAARRCRHRTSQDGSRAHARLR